MAVLAPHSKTIKTYMKRQSLQGLLTTQIPRMGETSGPVHPCYSVLVETGRTSSFSKDDYASYNVQNVDPRARRCYVSRETTVFIDVDISSQDLVCLAQRCLNLFGESVLADNLNAGIGPHEFLGAQLAYHLDSEFARHCNNKGLISTHQRYKLFMKAKGLKRLKKKGKPGNWGKGKHKKKGEAVLDWTWGAFWKHYRTFAKPTGLGYPGGLGPATFITYAKDTYGVIVDLETATALREVWHATYPEMKRYFQWVNAQHDHRNTRTDPDGNKRSVYKYLTPFGLQRAGASFCATANGYALQSPSAEGAKLGCFELAAACYDKTVRSILYGCRVVAFIHDEWLIEIPEDEFMHERAHEAAMIVVACMKLVAPDIKVSATPLLMRRWDKDAEPVHDEDGRLTVWEKAK